MVINADISCDFPLQDCLDFHRKHDGEHTIMATEVIMSYTGILVEGIDNFHYYYNDDDNLYIP